MPLLPRFASQNDSAHGEGTQRLMDIVLNCPLEGVSYYKNTTLEECLKCNYNIGHVLHPKYGYYPRIYCKNTSGIYGVALNVHSGVKFCPVHRAFHYEIDECIINRDVEIIKKTLRDRNRNVLKRRNAAVYRLYHNFSVSPKEIKEKTEKQNPPFC